MSNKIAELVEAFEEANDKYWAAPLGRSDSLHDRQVARLDATRDAILAEFAKLNAVREKLVEALKLSLAHEQMPVDRGGASGPCGIARKAWIDARESALAANAELEGK